MTYLTYFAPEISPRMWTLYPQMLQVCAATARPLSQRPLSSACLHVQGRDVLAPQPCKPGELRNKRHLLCCTLCPACPPQCVDEWAIDYLENVLLPLDNYISKGTDLFLTSQAPAYLALTNQVPVLSLCFSVMLRGERQRRKAKE